jgi:ribosomal protein L37AE/L43A
MITLDDIADLRGGYPKQCDFCGQPYTDSRTAIPEEAGLWTCTECWDRWAKEDAGMKDTP